MKALITFARYVAVQAPFLGGDGVPVLAPTVLQDNQFTLNNLRDPPKRLGLSFKGPVGAVAVTVELYFYEELTSSWYSFTSLPVSPQVVTFFELPSLVSSPLRVRGNVDAYGGAVTCEVRPLAGGSEPDGRYDFIVFYDYSTYTVPSTPGGGSSTSVTVTASALPTGAATEVTLASVDGKIPALGQAAMASSTPVVISSDQSTVPVNTELPAAVALTDATSTPTAPAVAAFGYGYNGTTWSFTRSDVAGRTVVAGNVANGVAAALPVTVGGTTSGGLSYPLGGTVVGSTIQLYVQQGGGSAWTMTTLSGTPALDATLTGGSQKAIVRGTAKGATAAADATVSVVDADHNALDVAVRQLPGTPSQEHTTAVSPNASRLTDGAAFYKAAAAGDNLGADLRVNAAAATNTNPVPTVYQNFPTFSVLALGVALGDQKSLLSVFLTAGGPVTKLRLIDVQLMSVQAANIAGVFGDFQLRRITTHSGGTDITPLVTRFDTADTLDANITVRTGATVTSEDNPLRKWRISSDEFVVGAVETESYQASLENIFPNYPFDPRMRPMVARVGEGFQILCNTNTTLGTFDVGFIFAQE